MAATILVVDDEPDFAELVAYHLRQNGHAVILARNGEEALDQARRHRPDLILLDLMLPEIDGFTVCELLRHHPPTRDIPILVLTAMAGQLVRFHGLASGAAEFLTKSVSLADLMQSVERTLRRSRLAPNRQEPPPLQPAGIAAQDN